MVGGWIVMGLFFSVFLVVGLGMMYVFVLWFWMKVWEVCEWMLVMCCILLSEVSEYCGSDLMIYGVVIVYFYEVEGWVYEGRWYDFFMGFLSG